MKNVIIVLALIVFPSTASAAHLSPQELKDCPNTLSMRGHMICVQRTTIPRREARQHYDRQQRNVRPKHRQAVKESTKSPALYRAISGYRSNRLRKQESRIASQKDELQATIERIRDAQRKYNASRRDRRR